MFCDRAKEYLSRQGVSYVERNVVEDETAMAELEALGPLASPVTLIAGQIIVGYNPRALDEAIRKLRGR